MKTQHRIAVPVATSIGVGLIIALFLLPSGSWATESVSGIRALPQGQAPKDARLGELRTTHDDYHPWSPPTTRSKWEQAAKRLRRQVKVAVGLWPMWPKKSLEPVIHGKIDRGDYTIQKVYFESHPGHYVTGNLYRPKEINGKVPGVLSPHGHWSQGRFHEASREEAAEQLAKGAEEYMSGARYPVQARMVQLARMGCVVFHYDMVGYADNRPIPHRDGFSDVQAGLWLQNKMGLQAFNSIRALDFLSSLSEVDSDRIGVTGASGGGTQTFILGAVDPRPDVAFPAVMASTGMQGGCVCENAPYLRQGINNIAISALFAPKPLGLSGADDWTVDIETKGLPELKQVYGLFDRSEDVMAKAFPRFKHNFNQVSRELMYNWFNRHLELGESAPVEQSDFWPVPPKKLSVWNENHSFPEDAKSASALRDYLTRVTQERFQKLVPDDRSDLPKYRKVVGTAARVMLDRGVSGDDAEMAVNQTSQITRKDGVEQQVGTVSRPGADEAVPYLLLIPENNTSSSNRSSAVLWIDEAGKNGLFEQGSKLLPDVEALLDSGKMVASIDPFMVGELRAPDAESPPLDVNSDYQGFTFGYNRPVIANRVRDILTALQALVANAGVERVDLVGTGQAGAWVLLAAALADEEIDRTVADLNGFHFTDVASTEDPMFLPGALKYGGIGGLAALAAPSSLHIGGVKERDHPELSPLRQIYRVTNAPLTIEKGNLTPDEVTAVLLTE